MSYYWPNPRPARIALLMAAAFAALLLARCASGTPVDERSMWNRATLRKSDVMRADKAVALFQRTQARYKTIEKMRSNGVPAPVLFCLHYRESDNNFHRHAHEGSPLNHRTRDEPKGRLPHPDPPYTFEQSAEDAYYVCDRLQAANWRDMQSALDKTESFNGFGYRGKGIAAPYNWSGTSLYNRGKFIADHRYSPTAIDGQLGCVAILKRMLDRGIAISFVKPTGAPTKRSWFHFWR